MKHIGKILRQNSGFTLMDTLVSASVLTVVVVATMSLFSNTARSMNKITEAKIKDLIVQNIISNLKVTAGKQILKSALGSEGLTPSTYPIAYSNSFVGSEEQCPKCPGRAAYEVEKIEGMPSLFRITLYLKPVHSSKPTVHRYVTAEL